MAEGLVCARQRLPQFPLHPYTPLHLMEFWRGITLREGPHEAFEGMAIKTA